VKTLAGAELFASGSWNGRPFSNTDLDSIVSSFDALSLAGRVPLKLTHEGPDPRDDLDTKYALGWVRKVWRDGDILKGDLEVPDKVHSAIADGYLRFVSVELLRNTKVDTRVMPWILDAVALLGADQPAVGILKDLQALTMRRSVTAPLQCESRAVFKRDSNSSEKLSMTEQEIAKLQADLAAANKLAGDLKLDFDRKEGERVTRAAKANFKKANDLFDAAAKAEEILPAVAVKFFKFAAPREDNHAAWAEFDLSEVETCIKENEKPGAKKFGRKNGASGANDDGAEDEKAMEGMNPSEKLTFMVLREVKDSGNVLEFDAATRKVIKANPELGDAYKYQPATRREA
jgi:hypothetical protein